MQEPTAPTSWGSWIASSRGPLRSLSPSLFVSFFPHGSRCESLLFEPTTLEDGAKKRLRQRESLRPHSLPAVRQEEATRQARGAGATGLKGLPRLLGERRGWASAVPPMPLGSVRSCIMYRSTNHLQNSITALHDIIYVSLECTSRSALIFMR